MKKGLSAIPGAPPSFHRRLPLVLAAILIFGLVLRVVPFTYSHFWDETVYLQHAREIVDGRSNYDEFDYRPPALPVLYAAAFLVWDSDYAAHVVQGLVSALGILFCYLFVRRGFGRLEALFAAGMLAFAPYFVFASHDLLTDMPAVTWLFAALWLFERGTARSALLSGLAASIAAQTRFTALFILPFYFIDAVLRGPGKRHLLALAAAALGMMPFLLWQKIRFGSFVHSFAWASRITREWTVPVDAQLYFRALAEIFPVTVALLFVTGLAVTAFGWLQPRQASPERRSLGALLRMDPKTVRVAALSAWGLAFFAYMLTIPHKEVRYLLPLAVPVVVVAAVGAGAIVRWVARQARPLRLAAFAAAFVIALVEFGPAFATLGRPWVDTRRSESVAIAEYIGLLSGASETVYATHDFPVLAYYSRRDTVSLLPIQADFDAQWRQVMNRPGFFVYYAPSGILETHSPSADFKPDRQFLDSHPEFEAIRQFPHAIVYRYRPAAGP